RGGACAPDAPLPRAGGAAGEPAATGGGGRLAGVGVGLCELVGHDGELRSADVIDWTAADLRRAFGQLGPLVLEADVRAGARAEALVGAGAPFASFVYVTVGTGISCCLVLDGEPYTRAHGLAGLVGSSRLPGGALEELAAGPALAARYRSISGESLRHAEDVVARALAGDTEAFTVVRYAGDLLGSFLAVLVDVLDPHALVIG